MTLNSKREPARPHYCKYFYCKGSDNRLIYTSRTGESYTQYSSGWRLKYRTVFTPGLWFTGSEVDSINRSGSRGFCVARTFGGLLRSHNISREKGYLLITISFQRHYPQPPPPQHTIPRCQASKIGHLRRRFPVRNASVGLLQIMSTTQLYCSSCRKVTSRPLPPGEYIDHRSKYDTVRFSTIYYFFRTVLAYYFHERNVCVFSTYLLTKLLQPRSLYFCREKNQYELRVR